VILELGNIVQGAFTRVLAKHSKSFSLIDCVSVGIDRMQRNGEPMRKQEEAWQRSELTDVNAKVVIYEAFVEGRLDAPKHLARTVHDLYFLCGAKSYVAPASGCALMRAVPHSQAPHNFRFRDCEGITRGFLRHTFLSCLFPPVSQAASACFHLKIDFGVDIGGVDGNMSQPRPDRVDFYTST
jgi:hypothetical protein